MRNNRSRRSATSTSVSRAVGALAHAGRIGGATSSDAEVTSICDEIVTLR